MIKVDNTRIENTHTEHEIKVIADKHSIWLSSDQRRGKQANFTNAILIGVIKGVDFRGAIFRGATIHFADFRGSNLQGADFKGATIHFSDFTGAYLTNASFIDADISEVDFTDIYSKGMNLNGATIKNANFKGENFES